MEDVVILPADKGNATVLMTAVDYDSKLSGMLSTGTYRVVSKILRKLVKIDWLES